MRLGQAASALEARWSVACVLSPGSQPFRAFWSQSSMSSGRSAPDRRPTQTHAGDALLGGCRVEPRARDPSVRATSVGRRSLPSRRAPLKRSPALGGAALEQRDQAEVTEGMGELRPVLRTQVAEEVEPSVVASAVTAPAER